MEESGDCALDIPANLDAVVAQPLLAELPQGWLLHEKLPVMSALIDGKRDREGYERPGTFASRFVRVRITHAEKHSL